MPRVGYACPTRESGRLAIIGRALDELFATDTQAIVITPGKVIARYH